MSTNFIDITNVVHITNEQIEWVTNTVTQTNTITSWGDSALIIPSIRSLLTFLVTCFIAFTGYKAYRIYKEQVLQSKVQILFNLNTQHLNIHNDYMRDDTQNHTRYSFQLHNIYHSICSFFINFVSPKDYYLVDTFNRLFYSAIIGFVQEDLWEMKEVNQLAFDQLLLSESIKEYCQIFNIPIEDKRTNKDVIEKEKEDLI